jgi:predicted tellurium resistance membrane protein TerC
MGDWLSTAFAWTSSAEGWIALATLTVLEIVLGIDNIVFISIIAGMLRHGERVRARRIGLSLAMFIRIGLLLSITWVMGLTEPLFTLGKEISGRDLILLIGGLFLIAKSTHEIHDKLEGAEGGASSKVVASFGTSGNWYNRLRHRIAQWAMAQSRSIS